MLKKNRVSSQYHTSASDTRCTCAKYKDTKSTHLKECWKLRGKSQSYSTCKCKDNSHKIRNDEMRNHLMRYDVTC